MTVWKPGEEVVAHCLSVELESSDGHNDTMLDPEQRIWGYETNFGGLADLALVKANQLMPKPRHLTWEEAATPGLVNSTAFGQLVSDNGAAMKQGHKLGQILLAVIAADALTWTAVLAFPGPAPRWLLVVVLSAGGPRSVVGFDIARTSNPRRNLGVAQSMLNMGGFRWDADPGVRLPPVSALFRMLFRLEQLATVQREQQEEGRDDQRDGRDENHHDGDQDRMRRRSAGEGQAGAGQQRGVLGHAPAEHDGRHSQDRQCAQASRAPGGQEYHDGESAARRDDDERQRPVGESVVEGWVGAADLKQRRQRERS